MSDLTALKGYNNVFVSHNNLHDCNPTFHSIDSLLVAKRHRIRQPIRKYKIYQILSELELIVGVLLSS